MIGLCPGEDSYPDGSLSRFRVLENRRLNYPLNGPLREWCFNHAVALLNPVSRTMSLCSNGRRSAWFFASARNRTGPSCISVMAWRPSRRCGVAVADCRPGPRRWPRCATTRCRPTLLAGLGQFQARLSPASGSVDGVRQFWRRAPAPANGSHARCTDLRLGERKGRCGKAIAICQLKGTDPRHVSDIRPVWPIRSLRRA